MHREPVVPQVTIAGLHRNWIGLPGYLLPPANSYKDEVNGISFYYGKLDGYGYPTYSGPFISINEIASPARRPGARRSWLFPQRGSGHHHSRRLPGGNSDPQGQHPLRDHRRLE